MSWTEIFPVCDDDQLARKISGAQAADIEAVLEVSEVVNPLESAHVASFVIAGKLEDHSLEKSPRWLDNLLSTEGDREWLAQNAKMDVVYRIHLANNLQHLVEPLTSKGMEVHIMASDSLEASPLWRLLPLEESNKMVTLTSVGGLGVLLPDLQRTEQAQRAKLAGWRVVPSLDFNEEGECVYHPIDSKRSGWNITMPIRDWLTTFYCLTDERMIKPQIDFPDCGVKKFANGNWLQSSYADWFLSCVAYPRLSADGLLTFLATSSSSALAALDIEYCTWANPQSQLTLYTGATEKCC